MASKVRAMTPAAMEAEREVSDLARLQLCCGPNVTCRGPDLFSFSVFNSIHVLSHRTMLFVLLDGFERATQNLFIFGLSNMIYTVRG